MTQQTKKQNKALSFFKNNLAIVLIVACMLAIIAIVIAETSQKTTAERLPDISINGGGNTGLLPDSPSGGDDLIVDTKPISFDLPVDEYTIATDYTEGDEFVYSSTLNEWTTHRGIDFVPSKNKNVKAVADGVIESVSTDAEYGTKIVIDHGDGLKSIYSSLADGVTLKKGDKVKKGDKIGEASISGYFEFKSGPHVHFEMTKDGKHVCPRDYLNIK